MTRWCRDNTLASERPVSGLLIGRTIPHGARPKGAGPVLIASVLCVHHCADAPKGAGAALYRSEATGGSVALPRFDGQLDYAA